MSGTPRSGFSELGINHWCVSSPTVREGWDGTRPTTLPHGRATDTFSEGAAGRTCKPNFVPGNRAMIIPLAPPLRMGSSDLPAALPAARGRDLSGPSLRTGAVWPPARKRGLFGLAPGETYRATPITRRAVRSYRTVSPLPDPGLTAGPSAVCSLLRCCRITPPPRYGAPCPVEFGLSSLPSGGRPPAGQRSSGPPGHRYFSITKRRPGAARGRKRRPGPAD